LHDVAGRIEWPSHCALSLPLEEGSHGMSLDEELSSSPQPTSKATCCDLRG